MSDAKHTARWQQPTDADGEAVTPQRLIGWLDVKFARDGEEEDKWAADYIRSTLGATRDRGPWSVVIGTNGKPDLFSDDFEHDVKLRISGDFADDQQRMNYANALAAQLNAARDVMASDEGEQESDLVRALAECRDAFPIPAPGAPHEQAWGQAMGDPGSVPAYVRASLAALGVKGCKP